MYIINNIINIYKQDVVCSLHFSAYHKAEKSYAQKVAGYSPKNNRRLKTDAIPLRLINFFYNYVFFFTNNVLNQNLKFVYSVEGIDYDDIPYLRSPLVTTPSGVFSVTHFEESSTNKNVQQ